jgi:hypothetical protein
VLGTTGFVSGSQSISLSLNGTPMSPATGGFAGTWNAGSIVYWCIELNQYFGFGGSYSDYTASIPNNALFSLLGQLFTEAYGDARSDATHSAAFQLAIWEIVYDGDLDLSAGGFKATGGNAATIAMAQGWLNHLGDFSDNYNLVLLHSATHQDFVTFGTPFSNIKRFDVPEPAPLALLSAALLAIVAIRRRSTRRATSARPA